MAMIGVDVAEPTVRSDESARDTLERGMLVEVVTSREDESDLPTETLDPENCDSASREEDTLLLTDAAVDDKELSASMAEASITVFGVSTLIEPRSDRTSTFVESVLATDSDPTNDDITSMVDANPLVTFEFAVDTRVSIFRLVLRYDVRKSIDDIDDSMSMSDAIRAIAPLLDDIG